MRRRRLVSGARASLAHAATLALLAPSAIAHPPPMLPAPQVAALTNELSGETAKRNLEGLARLHRQRGSQGFHAAAELVAERARGYGLSGVEILRFPADGQVFYGTQRSRRAWDADEGELGEVKDGLETKLASYAASPIVLAEDSEAAELTAELVDVGDGASEADYAGKDVAGKIVLAAQQPGAVEELAVGKHGAAGIVSYAQNQRTAWSGENDNLVRWGHLESFSALKTFGFMVSLKTARGLKARLAAGATIRLHARVRAGQHPGFYEVVTASIPGSDPRLMAREIAFSCHLDHQRPGANDNASGCVTILEAARALAKLIADGALPRPARTLRFIWPPEVEGTVALLNARPEFAQRIQAVVHMDMVGGGPETKAVFHVTQGPLSLPSFVHDVAWAFADWINSESYEFAATGHADYPLTAPEGGKEPLRAAYSTYTMGSDHEVYQDASFGIPSIYLNDWPDRYIHTSGDSAANIDPTKLKRAAFIGAASAYFLANFSAAGVAAAERAVAAGKLERALTALRRNTPPGLVDAYERGVVASLRAFAGVPQPPPRTVARAARRVFGPRGPLTVFGYDYFADHAPAAAVATPRLLAYVGDWGEGPEYAYEALNLANGTRTDAQIVAELAAEYGPVPAEFVVEYLQALRRIGIVE
jgi:aminopeptidase YwaD